MKFIHTADFHLSKFLRLGDFQKSLDQLKDFALNNKVDFVLVTGDVFDRAVPDNEARAVFYDWLKNLLNNSIYVLILLGNHDYRYQVHSLTPLKKLEKALQRFFILDEMKVYSFLEQGLSLSVFSIPHVFVRDFDYDVLHKKLVEFNSSKKHEKIRLIAGHFSVVNAVYSNSYRVASSEKDFILSVEFFNMLDTVDYIALGHIHKYQKITDKMFYSGSIERVNFGELNNTPGFIFVEKNDTINVSFIPLQVRKMVDLIVDASFEDELNKLEQNTLVRLVVKEDLNTLDEIKMLRKRINDVGCVFYGVKIENTNKETLFSQVDFIQRKSWVQYVLEELDKLSNREELKKIFLDICKNTGVNI